MASGLAYYIFVPHFGQYGIQTYTGKFTHAAPSADSAIRYFNDQDYEGFIRHLTRYDIAFRKQELAIARQRIREKQDQTFIDQSIAKHDYIALADYLDRRNAQQRYAHEYTLGVQAALDKMIFLDKDFIGAKKLITDYRRAIPGPADLSDAPGIKSRQALVDEFLRQQEIERPSYDKPRHAFFHSLIVDPTLAFDGDEDSLGYHYYMTTVDETAKILQQLYDRDYILVSFSDLYDFSDPHHIKRRQLRLPPNKKPLILSIDDVSYYDYMHGDGFISRLVLDENNEITGEYEYPDGHVEYIRDSDLMPLVDDFVYKHPDFSYQGAKGILAETGFEGVLGYRTNTGDPQLIKEATLIADRLKSQGWRFANHSYSHDIDFKAERASLEDFQKDVDRWIAEVQPIVGKTNIFISPFGYRLDPDEDKMKYLNEKGFNVFCPVSAYNDVAVYDNVVIMDRIDFDGYRMTHRPEFLAPYFSIPEVYDVEHRPVVAD